MIPRSIFGLDVDASARLLLALLWTWAGNDDPRPFVWPSVQLLAGHLRCTTRSVRRMLQVLREAGYIEPARRVLAWKHADHTVGGWILKWQPQPQAQTHSAEGLVEGDHPEVDAWADEIVRDEVDRDEDEVVHQAGTPSDEIVTDPRTISSALPSMDLSVVTPNDPAPAAPAPTGLVAGVLEAMRAACCELRGKKGAGPDDCEANRKLIDKCSKAVRSPGQSDDELLEDWRLVIARQLANVRHKPDTWHYLALSTLARPGNFLRLRDSVASSRGSSPRRAWSSQRDEDDEGPAP